MTDRALGDWQTPPHLVQDVILALRKHGFQWSRVLEPTCGVGNMIAEVIASGEARSVIGIEVQSDHVEIAQSRFATTPASMRVEILQRDIFHIDLKHELEWRAGGPLLILGNPPWVTNSELGSLLSGRRPKPLAIRGFSGLDSITGTSNFDVTEYITLKLLEDLGHEKLALAFLMKTSVARRVLAQLNRSATPVVRAYQWRIDAKRSFGSAVDACLLALEIDPSKQGKLFPDVPVYETLRDQSPNATMGFVSGELLPDVDRYRRVSFADGPSDLTWRQGPKHDAAAVMELALDGDTLRNRAGERVEVEMENVFPLLKGSHLYHGNVQSPSKRVIVTQRNLSDDPKRLAKDAPRLWEYLQQHRAMFDRRRSRIYQGRPAFSMFGVGDYTFSAYKVAISGFHKEPRFVLVPPADGRPTLVDDTCYFTSCDSASEGAILTALLNSRSSIELLRAMMFLDAKRPITKRLLQRVNVTALARASEQEDVFVSAGAVLRASGLDERTVRSADFERLLNPETQPTLAGFR